MRRIRLNTVLIWIGVCAAYFWLRHLRPESDVNESVLIAKAWLNGHGYIDTTPVFEQVTINGHIYAVRPIVGPALAVLAIILGCEHQSTIGIVLGATGAALTYELTDTIWLAMLYSFGTTVVYDATYGRIWGLDCVISSTFALASLVALRHRRPFLVGSFAGAATLARPDSVLALPIYGWLLHQVKALQWRFAAGVGLCALIYCVANWLRWHRLDDPTLLLLYQVQHHPAPPFSLAYLPRTLYMALFATPNSSVRFPWFVPGGGGVALILMSPALVCAFKPSILKSEVQALWLAIALAMIPSLLWYWDGFVQYGLRYWIQSLPFFIRLIALGGVQQDAKILICLSIGSTMLGFYGILTQGWFQ